MKQIRIIYVLMSGLACLACTDIDTLEAEIDSLEKRIGIMEESSHDINSNSIALKTILDGKTVIVGYQENVSPEGTVTGYSLEFSDGQTLEILFGKNIRGNAPVISINEDRLWTISMDGGSTFDVIGDGIAADGSTPLVRVDENGYWCVSLDDGASYNRITGPDGKPISAVNGAVITGQASVFKDVAYDSEQGVMTFTILETGETVSESQFRYQGRPPHSKETAIISLADACEAASRSLDKPSASRIEALVDEIFQKRFRVR